MQGVRWPAPPPAPRSVSKRRFLAPPGMLSWSSSRNSQHIKKRRQVVFPMPGSAEIMTRSLARPNHLLT
jgi:hypothetical protein